MAINKLVLPLETPPQQKTKIYAALQYIDLRFGLGCIMHGAREASNAIQDLWF